MRCSDVKCWGMLQADAKTAALLQAGILLLPSFETHEYCRKITSRLMQGAVFLFMTELCFAVIPELLGDFHLWVREVFSPSFPLLFLVAHRRQ